MNTPNIKRTTANDPEFISLTKELDHELWVELKEDQATYDKFNVVSEIQTAVLVDVDGEAVACGCFKSKDERTVEIKRMFVRKKFRGAGISKLILQELEKWAKELGYSFAVLETSIHFTT